MDAMQREGSQVLCSHDRLENKEPRAYESIVEGRNDGQIEKDALHE